MIASRSDLGIMIGIFALNAIFATLLAKWRRRITGSRTELSEAPVRSVVTQDVTDQLAKLAKLHDDGKITEEEFASAKKRLLQ